MLEANDTEPLENLDIWPALGNPRLKTLWKGKGPKKDRGLRIGSVLCKLILSRLQPWNEAQVR